MIFNKHRLYVIVFTFLMILLCAAPIIAFADNGEKNSETQINNGSSNDIVKLTWDMKDVAKDGRIPVVCNYPGGPEPKWFDSEEYPGEQDGMYVFGNGNAQSGSAIVYSTDNDYKGFAPIEKSTIGTGKGAWTMDTVVFPYDPEKFTRAKDITFSVAAWKVGTYNFQLKYVDDYNKVQTCSEVVSVTITEDKVNTLQTCTIQCDEEADIVNRKVCLTWDETGAGNIAVCQKASVNYYGKNHVVEVQDGEGGAMELPKKSILIKEDLCGKYIIDSKTKELSINIYNVDTGKLEEVYSYLPVSSITGGLPGKWYYQQHTTQMLELVEDQETLILEYMLFIPSYVCPVKLSLAGDNASGKIIVSDLSEMSYGHYFGDEVSDNSINITYGSSYASSHDSPDTIIFIDKITSNQTYVKAVPNEGYKFDSWSNNQGIVDKANIELNASFSKINAEDNNSSESGLGDGAAGSSASSVSTGDLSFIWVFVVVFILFACVALIGISTKQSRK